MTEPARSGGRPDAGFELKGATVPMTILELHHFDPAGFEAGLEEKIRQAPGFFRELPLLISLEHFAGPANTLDFFQLIGICRRHNIQIVGAQGGDEDMQRLTRNAALAWVPGGNGQRRPRSEPEATAEAAPEAPAAPESAAGRIITQPVRSGQQVFASDGDLVILAQVSAGAEVLAAGNIHVYGALRGRALAGVHGNHEARIFCQSLEAELVSVAGHYKISEDLQESSWKKPVQIRLQDEVLSISPLGKG